MKQNDQGYIVLNRVETAPEMTWIGLGQKRGRTAF